jgi:hypothetical protein
VGLCFVARSDVVDAPSERGLPPLPEPTDSEPLSEAKTAQTAPKAKPGPASLSFRSSGSATKSTSTKRKAVGSLVEPADEKEEKEGEERHVKKKQKVQKNTKSLLSFGDDA